MLADMGRQQRNDDDKGHAARLGAFVSMLTREEAHLDALNLRILISDNETARLQRRKNELRDHADTVLQTLTEGTVRLEPGLERARHRARHFVARTQQRAEAAIGEFFARDASVHPRLGGGSQAAAA